MTSPLADELRRLAALGHTSAEAATIAGCTPSVARTTASRHKFQFVSEAGKRAARIVELAKAGPTATEISAEVGICRHNVYRILKRQPDRPRPATKAQRTREAKAKEEAALEAERIARWREAWASKKAAQTTSPAPTTAPAVDEASLGDAMRRLAATERHGRRAAHG